MAYRLLLDVSSLMYRAFFAWGQELRSPGGRPVGAVHGYLDMVTRLLVTRRPEEIVHVYDHEWRPVARTDMYAGYKSNRPEDPEGLPEQFPMLRQVLDLTGMSQAMTRAGEDPRELLERARAILLECDANLFLIEVDEALAEVGA